jgi:hypothetical protein
MMANRGADQLSTLLGPPLYREALGMGGSSACRRSRNRPPHARREIEFRVVGADALSDLAVLRAEHDRQRYSDRCCT